MKRNPFASLLVGLLLLTWAAPLQADQFGLFTYRLVEGEVEITDYPEDAVGDVEIPSEIEGKPVTSIGRSAFSECWQLTSVSIPDSVTSIGDLAFKECIDLISVSIPEGVTEIPYQAFSECSSLTSVSIPDSVTSIGERAFSECNGLTSVSIPEGVPSIGERAFSECNGLTSVSIPEGVTSIGERAFLRCSSLVSVTIPDTVTSVGGAAFHGCTGLTSVTIGEGVSSIGHGAFWGCTGLTAFEVDALNPAYSSLEGGLFDKDRTLLIQFPIGNQARSHAIPDSVTVIGFGAFSRCTGLTSITIPAGVTGIGDQAFSHCTGLTSITLPAGVKEIGSLAFQGCTGLAAAIFLGHAPESVSSVEFSNVALDFSVYFIPLRFGFTSPIWRGYPAVMLDSAPDEKETWLLGQGLPLETNLNEVHNGDGISLLTAYALNLDLDRPGNGLPVPTMDGEMSAVT
ncbi:leucine-rich repeat domain-containing protein [bacterium]|nr:leucine-rich repeat domain-containing protein [bacterium]